MASVFKVMYETQPGTAEQMGVSAEDLATVTAEQAFEESDLNHDGRLSFEEFQKWYGQANNESNSGKVVEAASNFLTLTEYRSISLINKSCEFRVSKWSIKIFQVCVRVVLHCCVYQSF